MGEQVQMKRIHTKDLSQIFKSKKDLYTILMTEGQFYLPPFDDCTLDYLRDLMNHKKLVTFEIVNIDHYSICSTVKSR